LNYREGRSGRLPETGSYHELEYNKDGWVRGNRDGRISPSVGFAMSECTVNLSLEWRSSTSHCYLD